MSAKYLVPNLDLTAHCDIPGAEETFRKGFASVWSKLRCHVRDRLLQYFSRFHGTVFLVWQISPRVNNVEALGEFCQRVIPPADPAYRGSTELCHFHFLAPFLNNAGESIETVIAHELAHCYRAEMNVWDKDEICEEIDTRRLASIWGFPEEVDRIDIHMMCIDSERRKHADQSMYDKNSLCSAMNADSGITPLESLSPQPGTPAAG